MFKSFFLNFFFNCFNFLNLKKNDYNIFIIIKMFFFKINFFKNINIKYVFFKKIFFFSRFKNKFGNFFKKKIIILKKKKLFLKKKINYMYSYYINVNVKIIISFLKKNKVFLKSKFSKVRLFSKIIVFIGLLLNIIIINELHCMYYNISINYGYLYIIVYVYLFLVLFKNNIKY